MAAFLDSRCPLPRSGCFQSSCMFSGLATRPLHTFFVFEFKFPQFAGFLLGARNCYPPPRFCDFLLPGSSMLLLKLYSTPPRAYSLRSIPRSTISRTHKCRVVVTSNGQYATHSILQSFSAIPLTIGQSILAERRSTFKYRTPFISFDPGPFAFFPGKRLPFRYVFPSCYLERVCF